MATRRSPDRHCRTLIFREPALAWMAAITCLVPLLFGHSFHQVFRAGVGMHPEGKSSVLTRAAAEDAAAKMDEDQHASRHTNHSPGARPDKTLNTRSYTVLAMAWLVFPAALGFAAHRRSRASRARDHAARGAGLNEVKTSNAKDSQANRTQNACIALASAEFHRIASVGSASVSAPSTALADFHRISTEQQDISSTPSPAAERGGKLHGSLLCQIHRKTGDDSDDGSVYDKEWPQTLSQPSGTRTNPHVLGSGHRKAWVGPALPSTTCCFKFGRTNRSWEC